MTLNAFKVILAQWWASIIWPSLESLLVGALLAGCVSLVEYVQSGQPITAGALLLAFGAAILNYVTSKLREIAAKNQQKAQEANTNAQLH